MSKESYLRTGGSRSRNEVFLRINDDALMRNLVLRLFSQTKTALLRSAGKPLVTIVITVRVGYCIATPSIFFLS